MKKIEKVLEILLWIGLIITILGNAVNNLTITMVGIVIMFIPAVILAGIYVFTEED